MLHGIGDRRCAPRAPDRRSRRSRWRTPPQVPGRRTAGARYRAGPASRANAGPTPLAAPIVRDRSGRRGPGSTAGIQTPGHEEGAEEREDRRVRVRRRDRRLL